MSFYRRWWFYKRHSQGFSILFQYTADIVMNMQWLFLLLIKMNNCLYRQTCISLFTVLLGANTLKLLNNFIKNTKSLSKLYIFHLVCFWISCLCLVSSKIEFYQHNFMRIFNYLKMKDLTSYFSFFFTLISW